MEFRGKTRYVIADSALTDFVYDLYQFCEVENEFLNLRWQYSSGPTFNEKQGRKILYSDEKKSEKFFNVRELQRYDFKQSVRDRKDVDGKIQTKLELHLQQFEKQQVEILKCIAEKHHTTVKRYPFLDDVITPLLLDYIRRGDITINKSPMKH